MTVQEVWGRLDEIHAAIYSGTEMVVPFWIEVCALCSINPKKLAVFEAQKASKLSQSVSTVKLQGLWLKCFGSENLEAARTLMLYMMMFMIFGSKMTEPESINQTDVEDILSKAPNISDFRRWAVSIVLAYGVNIVFSRINEL